jgi:hypothetical protein
MVNLLDVNRYFKDFQHASIWIFLYLTANSQVLGSMDFILLNSLGFYKDHLC